MAWSVRGWASRCRWARVGEYVAGEAGGLGFQQSGSVHDGAEAGGAGEYIAEPVGDHGGSRLELAEYLEYLGADLAAGRLPVVRPGAGSPLILAR
jgi:hypothetical protein